MIEVHRSRVIDAPVDDVWQAIRRFDGVGDWNPGVTAVRMLSGGSTEVGGVRHIDLPDGGVIVETLLHHSDLEHAYGYRIDEAPIPVEGYRAVHRLRTITEGDATLSEWTAWFDCDPGLAGKMDHVIGNGIFVAGMQGLSDFMSA